MVWASESKERGEFRMIEVNKENFDDEVTKSAIPVVVDLWGPKCGPCLALMPQVEALAGSYEGRVKFCKLNTAENRRLCGTLRVISVPTFLFYRNGALLSRITGDEATIEAIEEQTKKLVE